MASSGSRAFAEHRESDALAHASGCWFHHRTRPIGKSLAPHSPVNSPVPPMDECTVRDESFSRIECPRQRKPSLVRYSSHARTDCLQPQVALRRCKRGLRSAVHGQVRLDRARRGGMTGRNGGLTRFRTACGGRWKCAKHAAGSDVPLCCVSQRWNSPGVPRSR